MIVLARKKQALAATQAKGKAADRKTGMVAHDHLTNSPNLFWTIK